SGPSSAHQVPAEGPESIAGHPEGGDPEGDGDDEDAADDAGDHIADGQPESGDEEPDDVENEPQESHSSCLLEEVTGRRGRGGSKEPRVRGEFVRWCCFYRLGRSNTTTCSV